MSISVVGIYIWRGKAYLPIEAQFESGIFTGIEPVYTANLDMMGLVLAIQKVKEAGHPRLPEPTRDEWLKRKDPVLTATKARSWKELARQGASYTIGWTEHEIRVDMSRLDKMGRWENDPTKIKLFLPGTSLQVIVTTILEDIQSRPEIL
jgi:hypothetical protein